MHDAQTLHGQIDSLIARIRASGEERQRVWAQRPGDERFSSSALNLAHYLAMRAEDLRSLQRPLMVLGLSSLGRAESRVMPVLLAVRAALAALAGMPSEPAPSETDFFAGENNLADRARLILGECKSARPVALMVTFPTEAAADPEFARALAERHVEAVRINCAHDDAVTWQAMVDNVRRAERETGHRMRIFMDIAGPKIRTGKLRELAGKKQVEPGDAIGLVNVGCLKHAPADAADVAIECSLAEALDAASPGQRLFIDDGKISATVENRSDWGLIARVEMCEKEAVKLKREKGLNFPDTDLDIPALTDQDRADLAFVTAHADGINFSFVRSVADIVALQDVLADHRPDDWRSLALILKIETPKGVSALPDLIVQAASKQPAGIMIARGDLSVEIGFARTAEMQEEILWLAEAAHVPVIWATQVLEHLVKKGVPTRGEMTDAAMAARAECVMLNKGPHLLEAIGELETLLGRMEHHQHKKTPQLRRLRSW